MQSQSSMVNRVVLLLVAAVVLAAMAVNAWTLADRIALGGFSPIDWINHLRMPENFRHDFPSGIENYRHSLFMRLYPLLVSSFGIPVDLLVHLVASVEVILLACAAAYLARTLLPTAGVAVPAIVAIMFVASSVGMGDLARMSTKAYFGGLYYNAAEAARLTAIAMALRRRWLAAALLLAFATASHPLMGALGAVVVLVVAASSLRGGWDRAVVPAAATYLLLAGAWILLGVARTAEIYGELIPKDVWIAFTSSLNYHWYSYQFGLFTSYHGSHLLPLIGTVALFIHYLPKRQIEAAWSEAWLWAFGLLLAMAALGVVISTWVPEPFLIKLNLQRASGLAVWIALPVVVAGLLSDAMVGRRWQRVAALALLLSPFMRSGVFPALAVLMVVLPGAWRGFRGWAGLAGRERIAIAVVFAYCTVVGAYAALSGHFAANGVHYVGRGELWIAAVLGSVLVWYVGRAGDARRGALAVVLAVVLASSSWLAADYRAVSASHGRAVSFRAAQDWARENTAPDAVFFVDPLISYGWRDYSQRSSFGNLREWLHTSWLYDSNPRYYREGLSRFAEFGLDFRKYLALGSIPQRIAALDADVGQRTYGLGDEWRLDLARRRGISYFVLDARKVGETKLRRVFANADFVVLAP